MCFRRSFVSNRPVRAIYHGDKELAVTCFRRARMFGDDGDEDAAKQCAELAARLHPPLTGETTAFVQSLGFERAVASGKVKDEE